MKMSLRKAVAKTDLDAVAIADPATIIHVIERAATNPEVDIEKMERLMQMHERLVDKQNEAAFNIAMTAAQSEMGQVTVDSTNPQTHSKYASYSSLDKVLRPI